MLSKCQQKSCVQPDKSLALDGNQSCRLDDHREDLKKRDHIKGKNSNTNILNNTGITNSNANTLNNKENTISNTNTLNNEGNENSN